MRPTNGWARRWTSSKHAVARFFDSIPHFGKEPLLWLSLIFLLALKYTMTTLASTNGYSDGSYYMDIAQNVRDGLGFCTDLSMYHQGMNYFPHPTPVYPVWPLVLGYVGRILPLKYVVYWLPFWLYIFTLLMAFSFAKSVAPARLLSIGRFKIHAGHVLVMLLGLHTSFFTFTSLPYTEGLTYALLFLALFRAQVFFKRANLWRGLEMGVWCGLLLLTRSQALLFTIALVLVMPLGFIYHKWRRYLFACLGVAAGFMATLLPYHLYLAQFMDPAPWLMLRFDKYVATPGLSKFSLMFKTEGLLDFIQDRAVGFWVAFNWWGPYSYGRTYHHFQYGLLVVLPLWLVVGVRTLSNGSLSKLHAWLKDHDNQFKLFLVVMALGGFASIHLIHKRLFATWNFASRHGITCAFLFFIALVHLMRHSKTTRFFALAIVITAVVQGHYTLYKQVNRQSTAPRNVPLNIKLAKWINNNTNPLGRTIFVKPYPQSLAPFTPNASYHWVFEDTTLEDIRILFDNMGAHFLLLYKNSKEYTFYKDEPAFNKLFVLYLDKVVGHRIYIRRRKEPPLWYGPLW